MALSTPQLPSSIDVDLESGTVVGEYEIDGKLGKGAFGTVYKGVHPLIGKVAAIKVLATRFSVDPEMVSRFIAEARAVNQIRHRHIIDIFSFGKLDDGRQYYVMEYLEGEPMDALLDRVGNLSIADALPILRAIAKAVDAAHAKGIAHRDLKPENVFLGRDSDGGLDTKLLDFGIAKLLAPDDGSAHKTGTGVPLGTPYYMSPEQCRGKDVDHRTDHYAFGVLMYRTLTGEYPFDGDDYMSILMKQINEEAAPPSTHLPDLPSTVDDVVLWLLAKDPAERPADLRTAVRALEAAAQNAGLDIGAAVSGWDAQSSPSGSPYQTQPPARRSHKSAPSAEPVGSAPTLAPSPARRSRAPLYAALVALPVLAIAAYVVVGAKTSSPAKQAAVETPPTPVPVPEPTPTPAPAVAPPPPVIEAKLAPATVIVTIAGVPEGTEVLLGKDVIGAAPGPVQLAAGAEPIVLTFRADGYLTASKTVTPNAASTVDVGLKKKAGGKRTSGGKGTKDDIINVDFGK